MRAEPFTQDGFSLVEVLISVALGALLLAGLGSVVSDTLAVRSEVRGRTALAEDARFAMERMLRAVRASQRLLIPTPDRPATAGSDESLRDPGVLAVTLDAAIDRDRDGVADADNDGDGRVDEDLGKDVSADGANGIAGIDDDGDGLIDEGGTDGGGVYGDDDEDGAFDEDRFPGGDEDGDGLVWEDPDADTNGDAAPGIAGLDDDNDGLIDEGPAPDDDEDGLNNEDWLDAVVFHLSGTDLVERIPVPWDENASGGVDGADYVERTIASGVSRFVVARLAAPAGGAPLVEITLELTDARGELLNLTARARMGGGW